MSINHYKEEQKDREERLQRAAPDKQQLMAIDQKQLHELLTLLEDSITIMVIVQYILSKHSYNIETLNSMILRIKETLNGYKKSFTC